jgi:hypothetical protein
LISLVSSDIRVAAEDQHSGLLFISVAGYEDLKLNVILFPWKYVSVQQQDLAGAAAMIRIGQCSTLG